MLKPTTTAFLLLASAFAAAAQDIPPPDYRRVYFEGGSAILDEEARPVAFVDSPAGDWEVRRKRKDKPGLTKYAARANRGKLVAKWIDGELVKFRLKVRRKHAAGFFKAGLPDVTRWVRLDWQD